MMDDIKLPHISLIFIQLAIKYILNGKYLSLVKDYSAKTTSAYLYITLYLLLLLPQIRYKYVGTHLASHVHCVCLGK